MKVDVGLRFLMRLIIVDETGRLTTSGSLGGGDGGGSSMIVADGGMALELRGVHPNGGLVWIQK